MDAATYTAHFAALAIDTESGRIYLRDNILPENAQDFRVVATVTDNDLHVAGRILDVDVDGNGINLPPSILDDDITLNLHEGLTADGAILTTIIAADPAPITYTISGGNDAGLFTINNRGEIRLTPGAKLDYDIATEYALTITAASSTGIATANVAVNVIDGDEGKAGYAILRADTFLSTQRAFTDPDGIKAGTEASYQWFTTTDGGKTKTAIAGADEDNYDTATTPAVFTEYEVEVDLDSGEGTLTLSEDGTSWTFVLDDDLPTNVARESDQFSFDISPEGTRETFEVRVNLAIDRHNNGDYTYSINGGPSESLAAYNTPITGDITLPKFPTSHEHGVTITYTDEAGTETEIDLLEGLGEWQLNSANVAFYTIDVDEGSTSITPIEFATTNPPDIRFLQTPYYFVNEVGELVNEHKGFRIDKDFGSVSLVPGTILDHETDPTITLRVRVAYVNNQADHRDAPYDETWIVVNVGDVEPDPAPAGAPSPARTEQAHNPITPEDDPLAGIVKIPDPDPYAI